jgi:DNA-binding transcriptional regulator YdaS (Cro superfamily)
MDKMLMGMDRIRSHPGLQAELSRALGITRGAVAKWKQVPADRVLAVERISGISRHDLRPDIYPPPYKDVEHRLARSPPRRKIKSTSNSLCE